MSVVSASAFEYLHVEISKGLFQGSPEDEAFAHAVVRARLVYRWCLTTSCTPRVHWAEKAKHLIGLALQLPVSMFDVVRLLVRRQLLTQWGSTWGRSW